MALGGGIVGSCERVQVGEREAAPRGPEHGEGGDPVGRVEDGAGQSSKVEDLLAFVEWSDFDGAVRDSSEPVVLEFGDDLGTLRIAAWVENVLRSE